MNLDFVTLGEVMVRFAAPPGERLETTHELQTLIGGSEANVAIALARLGRRAAWLSRLPDNPLGQRVVATLRALGVHTEDVIWAADARLGLYFTESGAPPRPSQVWYDRANSAASGMTPEMLPDALLQDAAWLHTSGITAAISDSCLAMVTAALARARALGARTSFDVNYRARLWSPEEAAAKCAPLCAAANVVLIARRDASLLFGVDAAHTETAQALQARWGGTVVVTDGTHGAAACDGQATVHCPAFATTLVDRVGAGDAFCAGVLDYLYDGKPLLEAVRFGAACAALKLTIPGDFAIFSRAEVDAVVRSGRAQTDSAEGAILR